MSRLMGLRTHLLVCVLLMTTLVSLFSSPRVDAITPTPAKGTWTWCTETVKNGCIEAVTTTSPTGVSTTYTDAAQAPSGLYVSATCQTNGGTGNLCDGNKFQTYSNTSCGQKADWAGGSMIPSVEIDVVWPGKKGWSIMTRFSTGDYQPAFLIGRGTTRTKTIDDGDGTYTFEFTSLIDTSYTGGNISMSPTNSVNETIALGANESVHVQLWPKDHLIKTGNSAIPTPCMWYPFVGAWAEANAESFSWSYSSGISPVLGGSATSNTPNMLKFMASAPHYKPRNGSEPLEINPARVQVFLPTAYFRALGYQSLDEFDASSYSVTTEDGQTATPTFTTRDDGLLINLGVSHYSAPNPTVTFKVKGASLSDSTTSTTSTTTAPTTTLPPLPVAVPSRPTAVTVKGARAAITVAVARVTGVTYSANALKGKTRKALRCVSTSTRVTCTVKSLPKGSWKVTVTPRNSAGVGTAVTKSVLVT